MDVWHSTIGGTFFGEAAKDEPHSLFENVNLLVEVLEPFPEVAIVLSTSWVYTYGYSAISSRLPDALWARVIGSTYSGVNQLSGFSSMARGYQILEDVKRRKPYAWVAVDDDVKDWPEECLENLVASHPIQGIAEESVYKNLKRKLSRIVERDY